MAYTTINKPSATAFNTKLYTGNGTDDRSITGVGFQPDWVWLKQRNGTNYHTSFDSVRGATKRIFPNVNETEDTNADSLQAFETDGFQVGTNGGVNGNTNTYVAWNWLANGTGSANTDGSINSTVSVNTTSGFSIVSYTGTGANATVGHGLGVIPKVIITKARTESGRFWGVYHASNGNTGSQPLNDAQAFDVSSTYWQNTNPTSSYFSVGINGDTNASSGMIAYCFAEKTGYSKFGSYTGNGNADGTFVYTGFKPAFVLLKQTNEARDWLMMDNKRLGYNPNNYDLHPNGSDVEDNNPRLDLLSNGFKQRATSSANNKSGGTFIYMAFAEAPLVGSNNVPCTAR